MPKATAKKTPSVKIKKTSAKKPVGEKGDAAKIIDVKKTARVPKIPIEKARTYFYANGKRKTSISMIRLLSEGKGTITINQRTFENYFPLLNDRDKIISPLRLTNTQKMFDLSVRVHGGGVHSQAEAIRHGISKALLEYDSALRPVLKQAGYLTRDPRIKERKKYGLKRARRAPQWQKR